MTYIYTWSINHNNAVVIFNSMIEAKAYVAQHGLTLQALQFKAEAQVTPDDYQPTDTADCLDWRDLMVASK